VQTGFCSFSYIFPALFSLHLLDSMGNIELEFFASSMRMLTKIITNSAAFADSGNIIPGIIAHMAAEIDAEMWLESRNELEALEFSFQSRDWSKSKLNLRGWGVTDDDIDFYLEALDCGMKVKTFLLRGNDCVTKEHVQALEDSGARVFDCPREWHRGYVPREWHRGWELNPELIYADGSSGEDSDDVF